MSDRCPLRPQNCPTGISADFRSLFLLIFFCLLADVADIVFQYSAWTSVRCPQGIQAAMADIWDTGIILCFAKRADLKIILVWTQFFASYPIFFGHFPFGRVVWKTKVYSPYTNLWKLPFCIYHLVLKHLQQNLISSPICIQKVLKSAKKKKKNGLQIKI